VIQPPVVSASWANPERQALVDQARRFAEGLRPQVDELDRHRSDIPREVITQIAELGYFGILVPKTHGGMGLGVLDYCLVSEELARAWLSVGSIIARGQGFGTGVADVARRSELLNLSARGRWIGSAAFSEAEAGSDLGAVSTTATPAGDDLVLSGAKRWCGNAVSAHFIVVLCRLEDGTERGPVRTVLLEKEPGTLPEGVTAEPIDKIGYHGMTTYNLVLDKVRAPKTAVIEAFAAPGAAGHDFAAVERGLNVARVQTAARAVGLARAAVEDTAAYLLKREQFGKPLTDFQSIRFQLAQMAARVQQARSFYCDVAASMDAGEPVETETAMVKLVATEMAAEVTAQALHLHGGNGYTTEHSVERYWRDARLTTIFEGTSEIQQHIISSRMLGRAAS
jgi:alkylation response protein AidB-like acyl-CoA dehydrogenase